MNMEKLQEVRKKTIFKHLVLEKTTKQLIQTVISKIRKYFKRNTKSDYKIDNLSNLENQL
jgi:hypothetical protein